MSDMPEQQQQQFFFDDFFVSADDPGVELPVSIGGQVVPIFIKRRFSLEDVEVARDKAIKKHINFKTGDVVIDDIDDNAFILHMMLRGIVSWPFKYRDGKAVPITEKTVRSLDADAYQQISVAITKAIKQKEEQVVPLEKDSAEVSSQAGRHNHK